MKNTKMMPGYPSFRRKPESRRPLDTGFRRFDAKGDSNYHGKKTILISALFGFLILSCGPVLGEGKWGGVDESVVEKIAEEHGRKAADPLINTDQGDLLLFVFLLAGAVGGFAAGYSWRSLTEKRAKG